MLRRRGGSLKLVLKFPFARFLILGGTLSKPNGFTTEGTFAAVL